MASTIAEMLAPNTRSIIELYQSVRGRTMQIVAPLRPFGEVRLSALRTRNVLPSYQFVAGNSMPS